MCAADNGRAPQRWIVSGGIGSGKSTVLRILRELGAVVIEADRIGREILEPEGPAYATVVARWPQAVVDGRIDRGRLAAIVFTDTEQLAELEKITHPLIAAEIAARVAAAGDEDVVIELPITDDIAGPGWTRVVIDAADAQRLARSVDRGMDPSDVTRRMASQPEQRQWLERADIVVDNSGTIADLETHVAELWRRSQRS